MFDALMKILGRSTETTNLQSIVTGEESSSPEPEPADDESELEEPQNIRPLSEELRSARDDGAREQPAELPGVASPESEDAVTREYVNNIQENYVEEGPRVLASGYVNPTSGVYSSPVPIVEMNSRGFIRLDGKEVLHDPSVVERVKKYILRMVDLHKSESHGIIVDDYGNDISSMSLVKSMQKDKDE